MMTPEVNAGEVHSVFYFILVNASHCYFALKYVSRLLKSNLLAFHFKDNLRKRPADGEAAFSVLLPPPRAGWAGGSGVVELAGWV